MPRIQLLNLSNDHFRLSVETRQKALRDTAGRHFPAPTFRTEYLVTACRKVGDRWIRNELPPVSSAHAAERLAAIELEKLTREAILAGIYASPIADQAAQIDARR